MNQLFLSAQGLSILAFLIYGASCMTTKKMVAEFARYGLGQYRMLTGFLQIMGALGLTAGLFLPYLTSAASLGLAVLMLMGAGVRLLIRDSLRQAAPALFFCTLNAYIFIESIA
ncbi:MAG: DoxX family protein [Bdellovibrio sp.]|jgi:hypothetical protein